MIEYADESLHPVSTGRWQESWYFNAYDPSQDLFLIARIGLRHSEQRMDGLVIGTLGGLPAFAYPALNVAMPDDLRSLDPVAGQLRTRGLSFRCRQPLQTWELTLDRPRLKLALTWSALHAPHDYRTQGGPPGIAQNHFEHTGAVAGTVHTAGRSFTIRGTGQRDKSWGVRDWARIRGWRWISVQFGADLSFNLWDAPGEDGHTYVGGYVQRKGVVHAVRTFVADVQTGVSDPRPVRLHIEDVSGAHLSIRGQTTGTFALAKEGLWIEECPAHFTCAQNGDLPRGVGVVELAYHVGRLGYLQRAGTIARTLARIAPGLMP